MKQFFAIHNSEEGSNGSILVVSKAAAASSPELSAFARSCSFIEFPLPTLISIAELFSFCRTFLLITSSVSLAFGKAITKKSVKGKNSSNRSIVKTSSANSHS